MEFAEVLRRRTMAFAIAIVHFCRTLPRTPEGDVFRRQLLRAGTSVGANYRASGCGRSDREWAAKLGIAVEEADECVYWLDLLDAIKLGDTAQRTDARMEAAELTRLLAASIRTFKSSRRS
jgi:four helix bundle protein